MPKILPKIYTREFSLILDEIWGRAYTDFLGVKTKTEPRQIFIIERGLTTTYRNPQLDAELQQIFLNRLRGDENYLRKFYREYLEKFKDLRQLWEKEILSQVELKQLIDSMIAFWPAVYASIHLQVPSFSASDRQLMVELRKEIDIAADRVSDAIIRSLENIFPDLGELSLVISREDLERQTVDPDKLRQSFNQELIMAEGRLINETEFERLKKEYDFELEEEIFDATDDHFAGQTACPGKVRGRICLVLRKEEISKIKAGEILVTAMTTPDFLPAMRAASAFVTDEGGLTCHAAIVARELKKPCVIGTKVATKILKDGDEVEVDASQGIIKILKR